MSAETLRRAAALMRERAEAAESMLASPWSVGAWGESGGGARDGYSIGYATDNPLAGLVATCADYVPLDAADHIASWHPAVALAVADWLDAEAGAVEFDGGRPDLLSTQAVTVARTYLGEQP